MTTPILPAGLSRSQAAAYVGLSVRGLEAAVQRGDFRPPARIGTRVIFVRDRLDADLLRLAEQKAEAQPASDPNDFMTKWRARRDQTQAAAH